MWRVEMLSVKIELGSRVAPQEAPPYPGAAVAYEFVRPAYEFIGRRLEIVETRIRALVAFGATLTFAAPAFVVAATGRPLVYGSPWFIAALVVFALVVAIGVGSYLRGTIQYISPAVLYENWLHLDEAEFKQNMVYFAGDAFRANTTLLDRKALHGHIMSLLLLVELTLLGCWAYLAA
jgi:hypothetical protein